jgi:hypothetical protein
MSKALIDLFQPRLIVSSKVFHIRGRLKLNLLKSVNSFFFAKKFYSNRVLFYDKKIVRQE